MPRNDTFAKMRNGIDDGYYLVDGHGASGDENGNFTCRVSEGYRIRRGVVCEPITDYVVWGCGADFLHSIQNIGKDFKWFEELSEERPLAPYAVGAPTITAKMNVEPWQG